MFCLQTWRFSFTQPATIKPESKEGLSPPAEAFLMDPIAISSDVQFTLFVIPEGNLRLARITGLHLEENRSNPFRKTNLPITPLSGLI